jgi:hypothetical protein
VAPSSTVRGPSAELLGGCRSWFAATPQCGRCDDFGSRRLRDGLPRSPEAELLCHRRTPLRIGRCGQRMICHQFPVGAIRRRFEPMSVAEMPAQHQATKPAFEADDMVVLHRSPNRDCRHQRDRLRRALAEATECAMHRHNQSRKLINGDTILRDITTDDLGNQAGINLLRAAVIGHIFCPNVVDWGLCSRAWFVYNFSGCKYFKQGRSPVVCANEDICIIAAPLMKLRYFDADF